MLRKLTIATFAGAAGLMLSTTASADVLGVLISGPTVSASSWTSTHASVTGSTLYTRGAGLGAPAAATAFTSNSFSSNTLGGAQTANDYVTWGLVFNQAWNLDTFSIRYQRSSSPAAQGGGPTTNAIQIQINGGAFASVHTDTSISTAGENNLNIDLSTFDNVTSVNFRYYGWWGNGGIPNATGSLSFQNTASIPSSGSFVLNASAVPEPAAAGLLGLLALGLLRRRSA